LPFAYFFTVFKTRFEGGAVLREQNALPYGSLTTTQLTAKDDVDNVGAGRAAKGENLVFCAKKRTSFRVSFFWYIWRGAVLVLPRGRVRSVDEIVGL
jgi:hypothetical protein